MPNLTITVDEETLKRARIRAIEQGESVNKVLAQRLADYANGVTDNDDGEADAVKEKVRAWLAWSQENPGHSGGWKWNREELYEERMARYDK